MSDASRDWDESYRREDAPPWDIGGPQPGFVALAERGRLRGRLLDAGCGTGEQTLLAALHGADAVGIDVSAAAIAIAKQKAAERGLAARFAVGDLLALPVPHTTVDTVVDSGVFHLFDDADRARYVRALADVLRPGGVAYLMCFSDRQPGDWGPRRVTRAEIHAAFAEGWSVDSVDAAEFVTNLPDASRVAAWQVTVTRRGSDRG